MADDYELLPHKELEYLRKEVERLKKNPLGDTQSSVSLLDQMQELNKNIVSLVSIFKGANDDMLQAYHQGSVHEQLRKLRQENAKIAHGIVALSKVIKQNPFQEPSLPDTMPEPPQQHIPAAEVPVPRAPEAPRVQLSEEHLTDDLKNPFEAAMPAQPAPSPPPGDEPPPPLPPGMQIKK